MAKFLQVGTIRKAKESGKLYINLNQVTNKEGEYHSGNLKKFHTALTDFIENPEKNGVSLQIQKPQDKVRELASLGFIAEEDVEARLASIPDYIKYEISFVVQD